MNKVIAACTAGASVIAICKLGDQTIEEQAAKVYNKSKGGKKIPKGKSRNDDGDGGENAYTRAH